MGLVYLPTNLPYKSTIHVGKYTSLHGILREQYDPKTLLKQIEGNIKQMLDLSIGIKCNVMQIAVVFFVFFVPGCT